MRSSDYGAARIRLAIVSWAIAAAILIAGVIWIGSASVFDTASPDFFPFPAGLAGVLAIVGMVHLGQGLRDLARRRKSGLSRIEAGKAQLGKVFSGRVWTEKPVAATGPYRVRLSCEHSIPTEGPDDSSRRRTAVLWEKTVTANSSTRSNFGIPFSFELPPNGLPSGPEGLANGETVVWRLRASAPASGLNYVAGFVIDVSGTDVAAPLRSTSDAFQGYARPEQPGVRILRFALPIVGALVVAAGGYASINQALHSWRGAAVSGTVTAFNRPQAVVALDNGQTVSVPALSSHHQWREGQQVLVTCRADDDQYSVCRMDTGFDRWTDAVATLAIGLILTAIGAWLWRRKRLAAASEDRRSTKE
ncbi:MAG: hypothetical protein J0H41_17380 [Rhizobiales bacterium]|nr:hypothetical protein [Hyphomicrobiales bacterium]